MFTPELDLRAIQIFLAVAEGKSVKKASEKLKISSPAISQALKLLEEDLGTELFCREVRPLRLTASGRKLQTEGINLLEAARSLRNKICSNEYVFQSLRLGIGESATSTIGPYLLALLRNKVSEISMESLLTAPLVEKLLKEEIDVLISVDPMFNDDRWVRREIYRESFLVLSKDKIENPCTFEDLQRLSITRPYISYGAGSQDKIVCDRFLRSLNVRPLETVTASSSYVITGLVHELNGWALLTPTNALSGKTFLDNLQWSPLPEGKQLIRSTWVVGDRYNREQQVDLVCKLAQEALKDKFAPHIKNFASGLSNYIEIVSQD